MRDDGPGKPTFSMTQPESSPGSRYRAYLVIPAILALACATPIEGRCYLSLTDVPPRLPAHFAELDRALVERANAATASARNLRRSLTVLYRRQFLEEVLPTVCELVQEARTHAIAGDTAGAGARYQGLLVFSQVIQLELAMAQMADYADAQGQVSMQIAAQLGLFNEEMMPLKAAALSGDRETLARAMPDGSRRYTEWVAHLNRWAAKLELGRERVQIARVLWDTFLATAAMYELAGAAADLAASARPPPGIMALAGATGASALPVDAAAVARLLEALRKLIASGALDPAVVAGISHMAGGNNSGPLVQQSPPSSFSMGERQLPSNMAEVRKVNGRYPINSEHAGRVCPPDQLPEDIRRKYPASVRFNEKGFPDFGPYARTEVRLEGLRGNTTTDFTRANRALGYDKTPDGYTWHHHEDCRTMQLVPRDLHDAIKHTGGRAILSGLEP